jgi:hypothetical protein
MNKRSMEHRGTVAASIAESVVDPADRKAAVSSRQESQPKIAGHD